LLLSCARDAGSPIGGGADTSTSAGDGDGDGDGCDEDSGPMEPDLPVPLIACSYVWPYLFIVQLFQCPDDASWHCEQEPTGDFSSLLLCCDEIDAGADCHLEAPEGGNSYAVCPQGMVGFCELQ
jgi:hypothetical protein